MMQKQIVSGSAWFIKEDGRTKLNPTVMYCLNLSGKNRPKLCYIDTAQGDSAESIREFYEACKDIEIDASHLQLFQQPNHNIEEHLLSQDVVWVGWGSVVNLLAVWREHGMDKVLKSAWEKGIVLGGVSAGSICWGVGGTTDSFGPHLRPITNGLALLPYSIGVHYDSESQRRPLFHKLIKDMVLPNGYATDDGVSQHFIGTDFHQAMSEVSGKYAYFVHRDATGELIEDKIEPELI